MSITNQWVGFLPKSWSVPCARQEPSRDGNGAERANRRVRRGDDNLRSGGARRDTTRGGTGLRVSPDIISDAAGRKAEQPWTHATVRVRNCTIACYGTDQIRAA